MGDFSKKVQKNQAIGSISPSQVLRLVDASWIIELCLYFHQLLGQSIAKTPQVVGMSLATKAIQIMVWQFSRERPGSAS